MTASAEYINARYNIMNNTWHIIGYAGTEPQVQEFSGSRVAKFSIAVKEYKAEGAESTMWVDVEAWGAMADRVTTLVKVGRELALTGRVAINRYTKEVGDQNITMTRVVLKLQGIHACGSKPQETAKAGKVTTKRTKKDAA